MLWSWFCIGFPFATNQVTLCKLWKSFSMQQVVEMQKKIAQIYNLQCCQIIFKQSRYHFYCNIIGNSLVQVESNLTWCWWWYCHFGSRREQWGWSRIFSSNSKRILFCPCEVVLKGLAKLILLDIGDIAIDDVKGELSKEELKRYILSTKDL